MRTIYLKTDTEQEMIDVLINYGFYEESWQTVSYYNNRRIDIDIIGKIVRVISQDEENIETEELSDFHVNLLWNDDDIPEDIRTIMIDSPNTPERVFFGIDS